MTSVLSTSWYWTGSVKLRGNHCSRKERIRKTEEAEERRGGGIMQPAPTDRGMVICHFVVRFCARKRDRDREKEEGGRGEDVERAGCSETLGTFKCNII